MKNLKTEIERKVEKFSPAHKKVVFKMAVAILETLPKNDEVNCAIGDLVSIVKNLPAE